MLKKHKIIPKALCYQCGEFTEARSGIFHPLCKKCSDIKKEIKYKEFNGLPKRPAKGKDRHGKSSKSSF